MDPPAVRRTDAVGTIPGNGLLPMNRPPAIAIPVNVAYNPFARRLAGGMQRGR